MRLAEVAGLPGVLRAHLHDPQFDLRAIHCDSRRADRQTGFVALAGLKTDGHRFVDSGQTLANPRFEGVALCDGNVDLKNGSGLAHEADRETVPPGAQGPGLVL